MITYRFSCPACGHPEQIQFEVAKNAVANIHIEGNEVCSRCKTAFDKDVLEGDVLDCYDEFLKGNV